jgi:hypothetical protein
MVYTKEQAFKVSKKLRIVHDLNSNKIIRGYILNAKGEKIFPPLYFDCNYDEIPDRVIEKVQAILKLDKPQFHELMICNMSREQYLLERDKAS